jgi:NACalpha-BTF3-like transcription factor
MALKGRLKDFSLTQLLNLVHLARKTGALSVEAHTGAAQLFFQEGKLVYAAMTGAPNTLADLMLSVGKLTQRQVDAIVAQGRNRDDSQLGLLLINAGQVKRDDIVKALRRNMTDVVNAIFSLDDGAFVFDQKLDPPAGRIRFPVALDSMVLEGTRQQRNVTDMHQDLPTLDVVLRFTDGPGRNLRNINLSVDEWRVISFINPRNTVQTIAQYNQMSEPEVRRIVAKLLRDGLVEVVGANGQSQPTQSRTNNTVMAPTAVVAATAEAVKPTFSQPEVDRNIIRRLIQRIRGL